MSTKKEDVFVPKRVDKKTEKEPLKGRKQTTKVKELPKGEKDELKEKYIDNSEFHKILKEVSVSQIERFVSLLKEKVKDGRGYSLKDDEIIKFVNDQIDRFKDADKDPNKANGEFYRLFKKEFMNDEYDGDYAKNRFLIELMKKYVRYNVGIKNMKEDNKKKLEEV